MAVKEVVLRRTVTASGAGSFGFTILGGHGSKFPAVVCEMDKDGPAALSEQIEIGDKLTALNGEDLTLLGAKLLVGRIRGAPSPSTFVLVEDEELKSQVHEMLRKQEEKRRRREGSASSGSQADKKKLRKTSVPVHCQNDQQQQQEKMLEIETSVNMTERQGVVQVHGNRILRSKDDSDSNSAASQDTSHELTPFHITPSSSPRHQTSSSSLEQQADLSSSSSSSLPKEGLVNRWLNEEVFVNGSPPPSTLPTASRDSEILATNTGLNSVGEVTSGGMVILSKQLSQEKEDQCDDRHPQTSPKKRRPPLSSPNTRASRNGSVRMSLTEEVFVAEISGQMRSSQQGMVTQESGNSSLCVDATEDDRGSLMSDSNPSLSSSGSRIRLGASPPATQDLVDKYTPRRSPSKLQDSPYRRAVIQARKMYMLDGCHKSEIAEKLSDKSDFGRMVAKEYLSLFDFEKISLVEALRVFLASFTLTGETQERERVIEHFSQRYLECNPDSIYKSFDIVHGLTCALLLLNSDLHTDHGSAKMSFSQFVTNLMRIGIKLPKEKSKEMYDGIKKQPLEWAKDEFAGASSCSGSSESDDDVLRVFHFSIPGTFVEVQLSEGAPVFKEGYVIRKNVLDGPHKKVPRGKRQWKSYYAYLKGFLLYFFPADGQIRLEDTSNAVIITHCLASRASDYHKKNTVLQVTTSDWHSFYLQANNYTDLQLWISAINKAAALYSAPPLASPIGSGAGFQRPTFPIAPTKNNLKAQQQAHESRIRSLETELTEHQAYKQAAAKSKRSSEWFEKLEFLQFETNRFHIYLGSLQIHSSVEYTGPMPTGLIPSPSISTLATSGMGDEHLLGDVRRRGGSPLPSRDRSPLPSLPPQGKKRSPLLLRKELSGRLK